MVRRLRTLTGCSTCRLKRVKCDESKPVCKLCRRHGLACIYGPVQPATAQSSSAPLADAMQRHNLAAGPVRRLPLTKSPSQTSTVFVDQPHFDMTTAWPSTFEASLPPAGKAVAGVIPTIMRLSFQSKPLSAAVAAIVADVICSVTAEERFACISCDMYLRSVVWLRQEVNLGGSTQDPMHLLLAALILGMLEVWSLLFYVYGESLTAASLDQATSFGDMNAACHHLVASMRLWKGCLQQHSADVEIVNTLRMSLEGCLFFLSSMAIVLPYQAVNVVVASLDWEAIESVYSEPLGPRVMHCEYSVHRSLQHELACLILQVTQASRNVDSVTLSAVDSWTHELERIKAIQSTYYAATATDHFHVGIVVSDLYICAIRIFVRYIANPTGCSSDPQIRRLVKQACEILEGDILRNNITTTVFWPLVVVLCAVREQDAFDSLVVNSDTFCFNGAFSRCWIRVVDIVRQARLHAPCNILNHCAGVHDGLRLLIQEGGIFVDASGVADHASRRLPSRGVAWTWKKDKLMKI